MGGEPETPQSIRTLLKKLDPAAKTDAGRCCWARLPSLAASAARTERSAPPCAARGSQSESRMREIRTSGLMSGDGKRSVAPQGPSYRARPRLYSRCPGSAKAQRRSAEASFQTLRQAVEHDHLQSLARYEVHLDRKLEHMLAMLLSLKELKRPAEPSPIYATSSAETWRPLPIRGVALWARRDHSSSSPMGRKRSPQRNLTPAITASKSLIFLVPTGPLAPRRLRSSAYRL
jgi:hypothetical protein